MKRQHVRYIGPVTVAFPPVTVHSPKAMVRVFDALTTALRAEGIDAAEWAQGLHVEVAPQEVGPGRLEAARLPQEPQP